MYKEKFYRNLFAVQLTKRKIILKF